MNNKFMKQFTDINGLMILNFSEILASLPYLLRSLRIQKMFEAREIYYLNDRIPKQMIAKWDEVRIIKIMLPIVALFGVVATTFGMVFYPFGSYIPNYNSLSVPSWECGQFYHNLMVTDFSINNGYISFMVFAESILLLVALNSQWQIESEYNIFKEIFIIFIIWFGLGTLINSMWIINNSSSSLKLPLNYSRWTDFLFVSLRSVLSIFFSVATNLYQSYREDQVILVPPDERNLETLDKALHTEVAIFYFYEFLENRTFGMDEIRNESQTENPLTSSCVNSSKLLALYMDIRCYDLEIRKVIESFKFY